MQIDYARRVLHFAKLLIVYFYLPAMAYGWIWRDVNDMSDYARSANPTCDAWLPRMAYGWIWRDVGDVSDYARSANPTCDTAKEGRSD